MTLGVGLLALTLAAGTVVDGLQTLAGDVGDDDPAAQPASYTANLIRVLDHEDFPFTEGLEFAPDESYLLETSGAYPQGTQSYIRKVDPETGKTVGEHLTKGLVDEMGESMFGEGITSMNGKWFALTYDSKKAAEYDSNMTFVKWHPYAWQGWGLARSGSGTSFYATNSSEWLMELHPNTFEVKKAQQATCLGRPVPGINELEMVHDFMGTGKDILFGNVYETRLVLGLDPDTAHCVAVFDLSALGVVKRGESEGFHVANGIAYRKSNGNFVVTGKNWDNMFEVSLSEDVAGTASGLLADHLQAQSLLQRGQRLQQVPAATLGEQRGPRSVLRTRQRLRPR